MYKIPDRLESIYWAAGDAAMLQCDVNASDVYKLTGLVTSFQQIIDNLFLPLFEVTNDPASHPELHCFLYYVSQFVAVFATYKFNQCYW